MTEFKSLKFAPMLAAAALISSCGVDVDREVESLVTVEQGVFGQTIYYNDTAPGTFRYASYEIAIYALPRDATAPAVAQPSSTQARGFYEAALAAGEYEVCLASRPYPCHGLTVAEGEVKRLDYQTFEPGWYEPEEG